MNSAIAAILLAPLAGLWISASSAATGDNGYQCKYDGNQQEMNACAVDDYKKADLALNDAYKTLMASLPQGDQQRLRQEQRIWLRRRDPQCKGEAHDSEGGSMWQLEFFGCLKELTKRRTEELGHWEPAAWVGKVQIQQGAQNTVCKAAAEIANATSEDDFYGGKWRDAFGSISWLEDSYPTVTAEGREQRVAYSWVTIDVDNDGKQEVIVRLADMQGSVFWDHVYIVPSGDFQAARKRDTVGKLLEGAAKLNPDNSVQFTNGTSGLPVEFQLWKQGKSNYVVLKEHFFLKGQPTVPNSLFVGSIRGTLKRRTNASKRLSVELVCLIRGMP